ncbi:hypothetical protein [Paraburkholderia bryophila]|uniref:Uncharacterized protein n=1 Tax=Paraburkholderia bryophila TaxID=420952 RepID=A0A7Y9W2R0_9BURK|nr:hypothetical protein [Paraburkholderia bryophila]NYH12887.1 hypothetical protein [Paraburkholderia bryophila]
MTRQGADEILAVKEYDRERDRSDIYVKCPHCHRLLELQGGDLKGEMFTDKICGGRLEVSHRARRTVALRDARAWWRNDHAVTLVALRSQGHGRVKSAKLPCVGCAAEA